MLTHPLIVALLGVLAGLIPGLLGGGGGWLLVPILVLLIGPQGWAYASGTVLCAYLSGVAAGVVGVALAGPQASRVHTPGQRHVTVVMTVAALAGTILGKAVIRDRLDRSASAGTILDAILIVALVAIAWRMLYEVYSARFQEGTPLRPRAGHLVAVALVSLVPGALSGLIGIGGGILYVPILLAVLRWRPDEARNASRICVFVSSIAGATLYALSGGVHLATAAGMFIPAGIVGVVCSAVRFGHSDRRRRFFKLLATGMVALAIALTAVHLLTGNGKAVPPSASGPLILLLALYMPVSWGVLCAVGRHLLVRRLRPGEPHEVSGPWFYQI